MEENYEDKIKVMRELGFPDYEEVEAGRNKIFGKEIGDLLDAFSTYLKRFKQTSEHSWRVALKGVELAKYLGINKIEIHDRGNVEQAMFVVGVNHDLSKGCKEKATKRSEEAQLGNGNFSKEDHEDLKDHTIISAIFEYDPFIKGIIIRHHTYQKEPYPEIPFLKYDRETYGERSPEVEYLARRFALIDSHDASLTRIREINGKKRLLSSEESMNSLIEIYGKLDLSYNGRKFPKVKQSGKDLITKLFDDGIFGVL